jgi:hypothetical protein
MVWLTWRQHRLELIALLVGATVIAVTTALIAAFAQRVRLELGVDSCVSLPNTNVNCFELSQEWSKRVGPARYLSFAFYAVPALVASYLGGPLLAREFERGTHRLVWTQGIGRVRWAVSKLAVVLAVALAAGVILALVGGQTRHLTGQSGYRPWDTFDLEGPAFLSFIAFGLAAGAFVGAWQRRILTGMFFGLLLFALVRGLVIFELRPQYEPPVAVPAQGITLGSGPPPVAQTRIPEDAWLLASDAVDGRGRPVPQDRVRELIDEFFRTCRLPSPGQTCESATYLANRDVYQRQLYQPADRYWRFQIIEAAIFSGLTVMLIALTLLILRRRDA